MICQTCTLYLQWALNIDFIGNLRLLVRSLTPVQKLLRHGSHLLSLCQALQLLIIQYNLTNAYFSAFFDWIQLSFTSYSLPSYGKWKAFVVVALSSGHWINWNIKKKLIIIYKISSSEPAPLCCILLHPVALSYVNFRIAPFYYVRIAPFYYVPIVHPPFSIRDTRLK